MGQTTDSTRKGRTRREARGGAVRAATLPRAVATLRSIEDDIVATLDAADRTLAGLEARQTYVAAGYGTFTELRDRLLRLTSLVQPLRASSPRSHASGPPQTRQEPPADADRRGQRVVALASIARALTRLHAFDEKLRAKARAASSVMSRVETSRSYEQCGYVSFEDFVERAVSPSPVLSCALVLVGGAGTAASLLPPAPEDLPGETPAPRVPGAPSEEESASSAPAAASGALTAAPDAWQDPAPEDPAPSDAWQDPAPEDPAPSDAWQDPAPQAPASPDGWQDPVPGAPAAFDAWQDAAPGPAELEPGSATLFDDPPAGEVAAEMAAAESAVVGAPIDDFGWGAAPPALEAEAAVPAAPGEPEELAAPGDVAGPDTVAAPPVTARRSPPRSRALLTLGIALVAAGAGAAAGLSGWF